ncbi:MAG: SPASM domain-containing protein [Patescibacteria group bacterium]
MNLTKDNQPYLKKIAQQSKKLEVDYFQVRPALAKSYKNQSRLEIPYHLKSLETDKFKIYLSEYKFIDSTKPKDYKICYGHNFCPVIDFSGDVNVCMYKLGQKPYVFGNLYKQSFTKIWKSKKRKQIMMSNLVNNDCQVCCKNHEINKLLYYMKHPNSEADVDFI